MHFFPDSAPPSERRPGRPPCSPTPKSGPAFLLKYFQAHINVEICASVQSVKYIHKYIYKGHDCANVQVTSNNDLTLNHDEVTTYINTRYNMLDQLSQHIEFLLIKCTISPMK